MVYHSIASSIVPAMSPQKRRTCCGRRAATAAALLLSASQRLSQSLVQIKASLEMIPSLLRCSKQGVKRSLISCAAVLSSHGDPCEIAPTTRTSLRAEGTRPQGKRNGSLRNFRVPASFVLLCKICVRNFRVRGGIPESFSETPTYSNCASLLRRVDQKFPAGPTGS